MKRLVTNQSDRILRFCKYLQGIVGSFLRGQEKQEQQIDEIVGKPKKPEDQSTIHQNDALFFVSFSSGSGVNPI